MLASCRTRLAAIGLVFLIASQSPALFGNAQAGDASNGSYTNLISITSLLSYVSHVRALAGGPFQNCLINGQTSSTSLKSTIKIAFIKPVFTSTPYSQYRYGSFYAFYSRFAGHRGNITKDLQLLNTSVSSGLAFNQGWGLSYGLNAFMTSQKAKNCGLEIGKNIFVLSDINLTRGDLFYENRTGAGFNVVVMGFTEYATQAEDMSLWHFVADGGTLILIGAQSFLVRIRYNQLTGMETLSLGHGWAFNGKSAWETQASPWGVNNTDWVGSNACCFHRFSYNGAILNPRNQIGSALIKALGTSLAFKYYLPHEESAVTNSTNTSIIATFLNKSGTLVASYIHLYGKGKVICLCIFGDDIIASDASAQAFLVQSILYSSTGTTSPPSIRPHSARPSDSRKMVQQSHLFLVLNEHETLVTPVATASLSPIFSFRWGGRPRS